MDSVTKIEPEITDDIAENHDAPQADAPQADAPELDEAAQKLALTQARQRRKLERAKKRAHALGMMDGIVSQLQPGDIALDCGANVGLVTRRLAATGATVYAFEPDPVAFARLAERCGALQNVHLINAAVGVEAGTATLHRSTLFDADPLRATVGSTLLDGVREAEAGDEGNSIAVPVLNLPAILDDLIAGRDPVDLPPRGGLFRRPNAVAFLKLDIEGAELALLNALHASGALAEIRSTVVETHERKFPKMRRGFARLRREMAKAYKPSQVYLDWV